MVGFCDFRRRQLCHQTACSAHLCICWAGDVLQAAGLLLVLLLAVLRLAEFR